MKTVEEVIEYLEAELASQTLFGLQLHLVGKQYRQGQECRECESYNRSDRGAATGDPARLLLFTYGYQARQNGRTYSLHYKLCPNMVLRYRRWQDQALQYGAYR